MKYSFHILIPFLTIILQLSAQFNSKLIIGRLASRNSIPHSMLLLGASELNYFARTTQKTQPVYCYQGVFRAPFHSSGSNSIVACKFVAAGMCLLSRCLAMSIISEYAIPAFGRHVTISTESVIRSQCLPRVSCPELLDTFQIKSCLDFIQETMFSGRPSVLKPTAELHRVTVSLLVYLSLILTLLHMGSNAL
jgi:hypothetical protein